jgi:malto-oligosyltrehalose trehalohydrolase
MTAFARNLPFGATVLANGRTRFRLWAPAQAAVAVEIEDARYPMQRLADGWFEAEVDCRAGARYRYRLSDGLAVPDPASRAQADDVHGPSLVVDPAAYRWSHPEWRGRPWHEAVIYELHAGTFSGFAGAQRELPRLRELGITAVELMPINDFPGARNWGYDGVLPFAPDRSYGTPDELKALIDAAHEQGLMIFLDVVYNHFGPDGNYLTSYAPQFFRDDVKTPWGPALDFRRPEVRRYFTENALYWLMEYRFDGLRFDAVHAIRDDSKPDVLEEIAATVRQHVDDSRHVHLVLENDDNATRYLRRNEDGQSRCYDAQWNDDFHHAAHVVATGETLGYYADYAVPVRALGRALAEGFVYQGEASSHRGGGRRGKPSAELPPTAFVSFLQNHDQIGNRAFGERLAMLVDEPPLRVLTAMMLLSPQIPMLFMGEEWASQRSFLFFCDFAGDLARAVREGRQREFAALHDQADATSERLIPDPNAPDTFVRSSLDWSEREREEGQRHLELVRHLLALRHSAIVPRLKGTAGYSGSYEVHAEQALRVRWHLGDGARLTLVANLSPVPVDIGDWRIEGEVLHSEPAAWSVPSQLRQLPSWAICFALDVAKPSR